MKKFKIWIEDEQGNMKLIGLSNNDGYIKKVCKEQQIKYDKKVMEK